MTAPAPPGSMRELLRIAFPLILSSSASSIQMFIDRVFLSWYSADAVAATMPAGSLNFSLACIFLGTATYCGTFVSQYHGARQHDKIGPVAWQGFWIAIAGSTALLTLFPFASSVFAFFHHDPVLIPQESTYLRSMLVGNFAMIAAGAFAAIYSGTGGTWKVLQVNIAVTVFHLALQPILVFGLGPIPAMGVLGAGIANAFSMSFGTFLYVWMLWREDPHRGWNFRKGWRPNKVLLSRLIHFGLPSGGHFFLDTAGFSIFILLLGELGRTELAATNVAFQIDMLGLLPMHGIGMAGAILVGQYLGAGHSDVAERSARRAILVGICYAIPLGCSYLFFPGIFLAPFRLLQTGSFEVHALAKSLMVYVACYSVLDAIAITSSSAIKGAGDTRYVLIVLAVLSSCVLVGPSWYVVRIAHGTVHQVWMISVAMVACMATAFLLRFLTGQWKKMRVIEEPVATPALETPFLP